MPVETEIRDGILLVTVANPPVNALSRHERAGLVEAMGRAEAADVRAVIIRGAGASFIAGADIREFGKPAEPPYLPDVVDAIERCRRPVIAAIAGQALGGGLEVALGCHYRIATAEAKLGLPEVTLGLVPGAGGTQRLPRLIDPARAATMLADGKPVAAAEAGALGLVDQIAPADQLLDAALRLAAEAAGADLGCRRVSGRDVDASGRFAEALARVSARTRRRARGAEAPMVALELVERAVTTPFAEGVAAERAAFLRLREGDQARALQHVFFAERAAAKPAADVEAATARRIERVGVVGAGTMGAAIAMSLADGGLPVTVVETSADALARGLERIANDYRTSAQQGRLTEASAADRAGRVRGATDMAELAACDLVVEAAFEAMEVKRDIFRRLDEVARPGAILATNTSYLDLDDIASVTRRPGDVVGLHYFSPANVMPLLEVVRGRRTTADVLASALALAKRTGKIPVVAGVGHGFIGNRMFKAYVREAGLLLLEGATPQQVDEALLGFGMAMGPFAVADLSGIDIGYKARKALPAGSSEPLATVVHDGLVEAGCLGRKSGMGFYTYGEDGRPEGLNPLALSLADRAREDAGLAPRRISPDEIVDRCSLALANEGGFVLQEGVAARPGDVDVVYVNGYGFPRHRGGPMYYAAHLPKAQLRDRFARFTDGRFGYLWRDVSPFMSELLGA